MKSTQLAVQLHENAGQSRGRSERSRFRAAQLAAPLLYCSMRDPPDSFEPCIQLGACEDEQPQRIQSAAGIVPQPQPWFASYRRGLTAWSEGPAGCAAGVGGEEGERQPRALARGGASPPSRLSFLQLGRRMDTGVWKCSNGQVSSTCKRFTKIR